MGRCSGMVYRTLSAKVPCGVGDTVPRRAPRARPDPLARDALADDPPPR